MGKKGSVCFFSLELDLGEVPRGGAGGAGSAGASEGPPNVQGGNSAPQIQGPCWDAVQQDLLPKAAGDPGLQRHKTSKAHVCLQVLNSFFADIWGMMFLF